MNEQVGTLLGTMQLGTMQRHAKWARALLIANVVLAVFGLALILGGQLVYRLAYRNIQANDLERLVDLENDQLIKNIVVLFNVQAVVNLLLWIATGVVFLSWLKSSYRALCALSPRTSVITYRAKDLVWAFLIPIVSLYRPYRVMRFMLAESDPSNLPAAPTKPASEASGGYRDYAGESPSSTAEVPAARVALWWGSYLGISGTSILERFWPAANLSLSIVSIGLTVTSAILAVGMVRAVEQRLLARRDRLAAIQP